MVAGVGRVTQSTCAPWKVAADTQFLASGGYIAISLIFSRVARNLDFHVMFPNFLIL
jgi:hypothetical protein